MPEIVVSKPGLQTTVQDLGRPTHQIDGFPSSGSMDRLASRLANVLVGNKDNAAVLEFSLLGGDLIFTTTTFIAFTGGDFPLKVNGQSISANRAFQIHQNDHLWIGPCRQGRYGYLAIAGGIVEPTVMDSRATTVRIGIGGHHGRALMSGDHLPIKTVYTLPAFAHRLAEPLTLPTSAQTLKVRVVKGPQWTKFEKSAQQQFLSQTYQLSSQTDRMGYRLSGKPLKTGVANMLSEATVLGGIQISANGQPIVLLADRQTTGGYPIIAVIISADLRVFVQCRDQQRIQFELVSLEAAQKALLTAHHRLDDLQAHFFNQRFKLPIEKTRSAAQRIQKLF
ncbi:biotin-dependent carboxyltransferase family protein [Lentilactobacillus farraginis]|uniref:Allophanate hydrolase 2 subunit 2 n=1 Tax=Lentilactobacillus farraginis DSM 18382 = JCM 14108 TaxID=1423743 RepID=X0PKN8_9LACO|nr:biotin-dependent carboxyltransferase family protein [Lentilactobacillus farraginis]KRM13098.1 biotin-dependent carboxylase domain protein [Lentilactobacillus farraginis DSM 18382 = JCM 14108]GAF37902.1 allophanate hydrolase 2 subunit 2 [Lentilactobacillus farraginis DSM 18382 = JCM 14108]